MKAHRISIQDTPAHLKNMLFTATWADAKKRFPHMSRSDIGAIAALYEPEAKLDETFWVSSEITDVIFDAAQDETMPKAAPGESWLNSGRTVGVMYETGTGIFTVDPTAPKTQWRQDAFGQDIPPVREALGFIITRDRKVLCIYGPAQRPALTSPTQAPRGPGITLGVPECPGEVPRVPEGAKYAAPDSDASAACINLVEATFLLMQDDSLTEMGTESVSAGKARKKNGRAKGRPGVRVRTVRVGRQLQSAAVTDNEPTPRRARATAGSEELGRESFYMHQFVVRGHWRNVPYGEGRLKRRMRWIMPFLKGPEGTPVIRRPLVRVWK